MLMSMKDSSSDLFFNGNANGSVLPASVLFFWEH
jgi:hypothetical protein